MNHWCIPYLNKKWRIGARGPDEFDCWGLVYHIYRNHFDIELPLYPGVDAHNLLTVTKTIASESADNMWSESAHPVDGCVVALSKNKKTLHHVGIYLAIDRGYLLHATDAGSVVAQPFHDLHRSGWSRLHYFIHKEYPICLPE